MTNAGDDSKSSFFQSCDNLSENIRKIDIDTNEEYIPLRPYLAKLKKLVETLRLCNLEMAPRLMVESTTRQLTDISRSLNHFSMGLDQARMPLSESVEKCITAIEEKTNNIFLPTMGLVFEHLVLNSEQGKESLGAIIAASRDMQEQVDQKCRDMISQCEASLKSVEEMHRKAGIEARAANFKEQADSHGKSAWWWLAAGVLIGLGMAYYLLFPFAAALVEDSSKDMKIFIALSTSKLVVVSLLTYAFVTCFRNYSANKHNEVVNRSRQVALSTFEQFAKGTSDESTKNAILTHACQSIFAAQTSGYIRNEPEPAHSNQIIEIVRSMSGKTH